MADAGRRLALAMLIGLGITFLLFWIMQALVGVEGELREGGAAPTVDFVRLKRDNAPPPKEREPPEREKPEQPPPPPEISVSDTLASSDITEGIVPLVDAAAEVAEAGTLGGGGGDTDSTPLVRVDPDYPPRARQRGIEGFVDVEFTITALGTVENPRVLQAKPVGVFEEAALRAIRRWRYNPKIVGGKPVARTWKTRLRFKLPGG